MGLGFAAGALFFRPDSGHLVTPETIAALFADACISPAKGGPPLALATLERYLIAPGDVKWSHPSGLALRFTPYGCNLEVNALADPGQPFHAALTQQIEEQVEDAFPDLPSDDSYVFGPAWMTGAFGSRERWGVTISNFFGGKEILVRLFVPREGQPLFPPDYGT